MYMYMHIYIYIHEIDIHGSDDVVAFSNCR